MAKNKESATDLTIERLLQVLVFVIPLIFFTSTLNFWELWKVTALRLAVGTLAALGAVKVLRGKVFVSKRTPLRYPIIFLIAVAAVSTLLSVDLFKSLLGEHRRYEGLLTLVGYAFLFVAAANYLQSKSAKNGVLKAWLLSCSLVSLYALAQYLGFDFRAWEETGFETSRSFSTMGNPVKLASYLAFSIPVFLSQLFINRDAKRYLFAGGIVLSTLALLTTGSRAGFIGLLFGVLAFVFFALRGAGLKRAMIFLAAGLVLMATVVFFFTGFNPDRILHAGSLATRWEVWRITLKMIAQKPLWGYGLDSFRLVFPKFQSWDLIRMEGRSIFDRPHNDLLQVGFSLGLLGLTAYLWLIFAFFWTSWGKRREFGKGESRWTTAGLLAGVLGYLVSIQFSFSSVATSSLLWIVMGLVLSGEFKNISPGRWPSKARTAKAAALLVVTLVSVILAFVTPAADYLARKGKSSQELNLFDRAEKFYRLSVKLAPWETLYRLRLGETIIDGNPRADASSKWSEAESLFRSVISLSPRESEAYLSLSALKLEQKNFEEASSYAQSALDLDPFSVDAYLDLGLTRSAQGNWQEAVSLWNRALEIDSSNYYALLYLAQTHEAVKQEKKALSFYERILALYPYDPVAMEGKQGISSNAR